MNKRWEDFSQAVVSGKSQADAYRIAYPHSQEWKADSVNESASKLAAKVAPRIAELRAELAAQCLWTREDSARALIEVINSPDKKTDIVSAVKELNLMHGFNAPTKHEIDHNINWPVPRPKVEG